MKELWANVKKLKGMQALILLLFLCVFGVLALEKAPQSAQNKTDMELRAEAVLSKIAGAGQVSVVMYAETETQALGQTSTRPIGIVIVAQGAADPVVRIRLTSAAQTLFSLPAKSIEVYEMEAQP